MYYVFKTELRYWRNHMVQAEFQGNILDFQPSWWLDTPFQQPTSSLEFLISPHAPKPDNFFVGIDFSIYSARMIDLITQAGVNFEAFPATLKDRKTKALLPFEYKAFHLLDLLPALDKENSILEEGTSYIEKLALTDSCIEAAKPLFRVKEYISLVLIHETLKSRFDEAGITGCVYTPVETYQAGVLFRELSRKSGL